MYQKVLHSIVIPSALFLWNQALLFKSSFCFKTKPRQTLPPVWEAKKFWRPSKRWRRCRMGGGASNFQWSKQQVCVHCELRHHAGIAPSTACTITNIGLIWSSSTSFLDVARATISVDDHVPASTLRARLCHHGPVFSTRHHKPRAKQVSWSRHSANRRGGNYLNESVGLPFYLSMC